MLDQGAWQAVNYRAHPAWDEAARDLTDGAGVGRVREMVGGDNARRSLNALGADGRLSVIGHLGGMELSFPIIPFLQNRIAVQGISIGHRRAFERMNEAIETLAIKPVIDKVHGFDEVPRAFEHLETGAVQQDRDRRLLIAVVRGGGPAVRLAPTATAAARRPPPCRR